MDSNEFWNKWAVLNRAWIDQALLDYGAILVRGFAITDAAKMEAAIMAYQPTLNNTYRGTSPRILIDNTKHVFSAGKFSTL